MLEHSARNVNSPAANSAFANADLGNAPLQSKLRLPRVAVIVTCYNYARFVEDALDSVAAQTYPNFECVIVDDASTDDSLCIIERWIAAANDSRFRLIKSVSNRG